MPKADRVHSTQRPSAPSPDTHAATIARLREIDAQASEALVLPYDEPRHPDHDLLVLCADALTELGIHTRFENERFAHMDYGSADPASKHMRHLCDVSFGHHKAAMRLVRRARKIKATTPAGIYAKAFLARGRDGATILGQSLAEDLVSSTALRLLFWHAFEMPTDAAGV